MSVIGVGGSYSIGDGRGGNATAPIRLAGAKARRVCFADSGISAPRRLDLPYDKDKRDTPKAVGLGTLSLCGFLASGCRLCAH